MKKVMDNYVITGLDIGNGYVKGRFLGVDGRPLNIDIPSCVAGLSVPPAIPVEVTDEYIENIFNNMVCLISSPVVKEKRYIIYGKGSINSGRSLTEFDIAASSFSKAQQDLSGILVLGAVAGAVLRNFWATNHMLPQTELTVTNVGALALPIDEYMAHRDEFAGKFMNYEHEVSIYNFGQPIHIKIKFQHVTVMPEGASAQYAITGKGEPFMQALLDDVRSHDPNALAGITATDLLQCTNTCGIDIGEGTVNFPVFTNGEFNHVVSATIQKGYGTILEQSLDRVRAEHMPYNTRKALADLLQQPTTAFSKRRQQTVRDIVNEEAKDLVNDIVRQVSRVLASGSVDVIYVYGGGATPMKEALYEPLINIAREFSGGDEFPILYLDSSYARNLNREGMFTVAMADYQSIVNE